MPRPRADVVGDLPGSGELLSLDADTDGEMRPLPHQRKLSAAVEGSRRAFSKPSLTTRPERTVWV